MERLRRLMRHNDAGIALSAGLLFVGCALSSESFLSAYNLFNISRIVAFSVLVALAQALVLVAGGDESVRGGLSAAWRPLPRGTAFRYWVCRGG